MNALCVTQSTDLYQISTFMLSGCKYFIQDRRDKVNLTHGLKSKTAYIINNGIHIITFLFSRCLHSFHSLINNLHFSDINVSVVKPSSRCPTDKHFELCSFDSVQGAAPRTHCRYVCECQPDCSDMMVSLSGKQRATSYAIREVHWQPKQDVDTGNTCTHSQAGWLEDRVATLGDDSAD